MHYQRIVPFFQLTTSASLVVALSVALTPHLEVYRPKDFDDCRRDGGSIVACCRLAGGYLNQDATKCMASYLFRGPSQSDGGGEEPASPPRAPTQSAPQ